MAEPQFVHLRLHTEYSLLDSVVRVKALAARLRELAMPAVAVTDHNNLFAMVKFYRASLAAGIKPIIGVDLLLRQPDERAAPARFSLLCLDQVGYRNVTRLVTRAYLEGQQKGVPLVDRGWLTAESCAGLIALSGAGEGDVGRALANGREGDARVCLDDWRGSFGERYFLELQRVGRADEANYIEAATELAERTGTPVVATNDVRFLAPADFEAHEARVCIHEGSQLADPNRPRRYTAQQYLRTAGEMAQLFSDLPEALANSVAIARRCSLTLSLGEARLPVFPAPDGSTIEQFIRRESQHGLDQRLAALGDARACGEQDYRDRLTTELAVICDMGFAGYFLIVADFIRWARENGVPVGPGRGSGAGSLVAYALGITDIDPLKYDLLFERFLNP
ncbi:MAG: PHP domain-containing protein, partial [Pseudomonadales bacterium]|nr:PHP domain-containing protein [Pseudomonadales bacterium]